MMRMRAMLLALALSLLAGCAPARPRPALRAEDAWLRAADSAGTTAGYLTLVNDSDHDVAMVGAETALAREVQMHETLHDGALSRMQQTARLVAPAHGALKFAPGGNHLMIMGLSRTLAAGTQAELTLRLEDGDTLRVDAEVRR
jgi:copper(I)-binding protein